MQIKPGFTAVESIKDGCSFSEEDFECILQEHGMKTSLRLAATDTDNKNYNTLPYYRAYYILTRD